MNYRRSGTSLTAVIPAKADAAWALLSDWAGILKWWPKDDAPFPIERVDLVGKHGETPRMRRIFLKEGPVGEETLLKEDPVGRRIYYDMREGSIPGIHNYLATTTIDAIDDRSCRINFSSSFDLDHDAPEETMKGIISSVYDAIARGFTSHFKTP